MIYNQSYFVPVGHLNHRAKIDVLSVKITLK